MATTTPVGLSCYLDVPGFLASQPALPLAGLLGGNTILAAGGCAVGATSLAVLASSGFLPSAPVYILDGPNSEIVFADATAPTPDATHLTIAGNTAGGTGTQFAHGARTSVSSGGSLGALADTLLASSSWVEDFCDIGGMSSASGAAVPDHSFWSATRTEKLPLATRRAFLDRGYGLQIVPHWWPVTSLTSVSVEYAPNTQLAYDASQMELGADARIITIPQLVPASGNTSLPLLPAFYPRGAQLWASITYTAGFPYATAGGGGMMAGMAGTVPYNFLRAVSFVVREYLAYAQNPTGAAQVRQGDVQLMQRLRGSGGKESSADSIFMAQAKSLLQRYTTVLF